MTAYGIRYLDVETRDKPRSALKASFSFPFYPISADRRSGDLDPIFYCSVIEFVKKVCVCSVAPSLAPKK